MAAKGVWLEKYEPKPEAQTLQNVVVVTMALSNENLAIFEPILKDGNIPYKIFR